MVRINVVGYVLIAISYHRRRFDRWTDRIGSSARSASPID